MNIRTRAATLALVATITAAELATQTTAITNVRERAHHVLNRITHGPTPALVNTLTSHALIDSFIQSQLNADSNYSTSTAARRAELGVPPGTTAQVAHGWDLEDLQKEHLILGIQGSRQLREVMARFWMTHFSTSYQKSRQPFTDESGSGGNSNPQKGVWAEYTEYKEYRRLAFNNFSDLLVASFNSAAMRSYLNVFASRKASPNEDYPREFAELHALGEVNESTGDRNYDQEDVREISRVFTGYRVNWATGLTFADVSEHDLGDKLIFANVATPTLTINSSQWTQDQAATLDPLRLIGHVVGTDACKDFICRKLIRWFIGDEDVSASLLATCKSPAVWNARGNIKAVLNTILTSNEFNDAARIGGRIEQPFETLCSMARQFDATLSNAQNVHELWRRLQFSQQRLYEFPSPDGYPLASLEQPGSSIFMHFGRAAREVRDATIVPIAEMPNLGGMYAPYLALTPAGRADGFEVAKTFVDTHYPGRYSSADVLRAQAYLYLDAAGNPSNWDSSNPLEVRERIPRMCMFLASMPQAFQK